MITEQQLNEWEELAKAATPGPWEAELATERGSWIRQSDTSNLSAMSWGNTDQEGAANAIFIAASRTAVPALVEMVRELKAENERLRKVIGGSQWHWPADDTSSDVCADGPWEIAENFDLPSGNVMEYLRGGVVETRFYAFLDPAEDADSDDNFEVDEATEEAAYEKIAAELERRAALGRQS